MFEQGKVNHFRDIIWHKPRKTNYHGKLNQFSEYHDYGVLSEGDYKVYSGTFLAGKRHGTGVQNHGELESFNGEWELDIFISGSYTDARKNVF